MITIPRRWKQAWWNVEEQVLLGLVWFCMGCLLLIGIGIFIVGVITFPTEILLTNHHFDL